LHRSWDFKAANLLGTKLADTFVSLPGASVPEGAVGLELAFFGSDLAGCLGRDTDGQRERNTGGGSVEVIALLSRVSTWSQRS
jgi:hypothetical protein